jgi:uncharacterized protein with HEPN domain
MSDKNLMVLSTLEDIKHSIKLILSRFESINSADDFLLDETGLILLDSISMRLVAVREGFKNIDKLTDKKLLQEYPHIDWKGVKGIRDILSHHYFDLDAETIFDICENDLDALMGVAESMTKSL